MSTAGTSVLKAKRNDGRNDYLCGNHPLWQFSRALYQLGKKPRAAGGLMLLYGYLEASFRREPRPITAELMAFIRREQMARLKSIFGKLLGSQPEVAGKPLPVSGGSPAGKPGTR